MEYSCKQCLHKSKRNSCFLGRNLSSYPQGVKEMVYNGLVRPVLEYARKVREKSRECHNHYSLAQRFDNSILS